MSMMAQIIMMTMAWRPDNKDNNGVIARLLITSYDMIADMYCGSWILALEFFMSFSLLILLGWATAGVHCREEIWPLNRSENAEGLWPLNRSTEPMNPLGICHSRCRFGWMAHAHAGLWPGNWKYGFFRIGKRLRIACFAVWAFSYYQCIPIFLEKNRATSPPEFRTHPFSAYGYVHMYKKEGKWNGREILIYRKESDQWARSSMDAANHQEKIKCLTSLHWGPWG